MGYENALYEEKGNLIQAFRECAEEYGIHFTVEQYKEYTQNNPYAPSVHEIFSKTRFNKIKLFLFGEKSLNHKKHSIDEIKRDYKTVCDRNNRPLNIGEYGRKKDKDMVSSRLIRKKTTSSILKKWYRQKKKDELLGTNKANHMRIRRNRNFDNFCEECARDKNDCKHTRETCSYWNDKILGE